ncbi:SprB repeat-containing protein [Tenacibaculum sp. IB213877]|uniref:SprB repeat-containing protein n=1 Tax=Tenacibaculum sp. IB213877 TaxID=3097351 RepID=UPI002A59B097|nr:SprB repeat-containing protein [Tenacibaculum sp. IB213877]MDY0779358.1 SprB repeat-containing protein [Tenacibaculum sp. IB213877]
MKKIIIVFLIFLTNEVCFSQTYYLNVDWEGTYSCSGGAYYSEFFHTTTIYDSNNNVLDQVSSDANVVRTSYKGIFATRPHRIKHVFNCQVLEGSYSGFTNSGEVTLSSGDCVSNSAQNVVAKLSIPLTTLNQPANNTFCNKGTLSIGAHNDCNSYRYRWRYSTNGSSFPYVGVTTIGGSNSNPNLSSFLPNGYTGNLFVKADISYDNGSSYTNETNVITYTIIPCSPQLLSFTPIDTRCSYSDDGSFSMILNRDLELGKKLVVSLFYEFEPVTNPNVFNLLDQKDTTVLTDNGDGTYTYQWPSDTPIFPGNYKVRYQTYDITTPNPIWNSLEGTEDGFTIGNPPPVVFSAAKVNDVNCKDSSDGTIQVNASGGVGNFKYQVNGGTWIPFTSRSTSIITGLSQGLKKMKVKDANGCTAKE